MDDDLVYLSREPLNAETRLDRHVGAITPAERHYKRNHFPIPAAPPHLTIDGAVRTKLQLDLDDIRAMPSRTIAVTLECAGNGRAFLEPAVPGEQWSLGAVGTAEWTGVPLSALVAMSRPRPSAIEVLCVGADSGTPAGAGGRIAYERSLPASERAVDDVLLAYAMNGAPLPREHGAPLRLIVPGWYGMASVKWLTRLQFIERKFAGFFQASRYVIGDRPLTRIAPRAVIAAPRDGERLAPRAFVARGYAWSGDGDIARVQVSADGGHTWQAATLGEAPSPYAWREWQYTVTPDERGPLTLVARALVASGSVQPHRQVWNALGYMNNAVRPVRVEIVSG